MLRDSAWKPRAFGDLRFQALLEKNDFHIYSEPPHFNFTLDLGSSSTLQNGKVQFTVQNYRKQGKKETCTLTAPEFLRRFTLHNLSRESESYPRVLPGSDIMASWPVHLRPHTKSISTVKSVRSLRSRRKTGFPVQKLFLLQPRTKNNLKSETFSFSHRKKSNRRKSFPIVTLILNTLNWPLSTVPEPGEGTLKFTMKLSKGSTLHSN